MNKKFLFFLLVGALALPMAIRAQTLGGMAASAASAAAAAVTGIVIIMWLVTGVLFLIAQGSPEKLSSAKKALFASVAGTVIAILAHAARSVVGSIFGI